MEKQEGRNIDIDNVIKHYETEHPEWVDIAGEYQTRWREYAQKYERDFTNPTMKEEIENPDIFYVPLHTYTDFAFREMSELC